MFTAPAASMTAFSSVPLPGTEIPPLQATTRSGRAGGCAASQASFASICRISASPRSTSPTAAAAWRTATRASAKLDADLSSTTRAPTRLASRRVIGVEKSPARIRSGLKRMMSSAVP